MKKDSTSYGAVRPTWDKNDCSVRALACAVNCPYEVASMLFSAFGRQVKKGTPQSISADLYQAKLFMEEVKGVEGWPLAAFTEVYGKGRFIVHKKSHAFAVIDGVVHDWERTTKVLTKIQRVWRVTEKTELKVTALKAAFA